jgi:uncharacterized protein (DUF488 family)
VELVSVGHGTASAPQLIELLTGAGVQQVVDVRRYPASRTHPQVHREALAGYLPAAGIGYRWEERLGGRRRLPPQQSPDTWWRVEAFRAYAAHMRTTEFGSAMAELADGSRSGPGRTALLCSESVWWRCHRRLIADYLDLILLQPVLHLMPGGRLTPHEPSAGARIAAPGLLIYDLIAPAPAAAPDRPS